MQPSDILNFWFADETAAKWWVKDAGFDAEIREKFTDIYEQAKNGQLNDWQNDAESCLALILILDQFPRNMFRDSGQAFATDGVAISLVYHALERGYDLALKEDKPEAWRAFMYMPLMHSEQLRDQVRCVELFTTHGPAANVPFAQRHHDIIARFGRFPHRNTLLGRVSTVAEQAFLNQAGTSF